jgi:hypothetical protein
MNDSAVVPALMPADTTFLFEQQQPKPGKSPRDLKPHSKADNPSADDDDFVAGFDH